MAWNIQRGTIKIKEGKFRISMKKSDWKQSGAITNSL